MALSIRVAPVGQSATQPIMSGMQKFFSLLDGDEAVMLTKCGAGNALKRDAYESFVPLAWTWDASTPGQYTEALWQTFEDETLPISGSITIEPWVIQIANAFDR